MPSFTDLGSFFFHQIRESEEEVDRCYEPMIGIVTDNKDPEKLFRVKVKFPSVLASETTHWIPVVSMGAGKDRGWFFLPEVDDEVLVAFEHGDFNRPIVIGRLWNGKDKPPEQQSSSNDKRVIKSRGGSKIEFDDNAGTITISDGGGKGEIKIDSGANTVTLTAKQGDVGLQCKDGMQILAGEVSIKASGNADLMGKSSGVDMSATATVKVDGNMVALKGSTIDVNPGGVPKAAKASTSPAATADPLNK